MSDYGLDDICGNCGSRLGTSVLAVPNGSDNDAVLPPEDKWRLEHGIESVDPGHYKTEGVEAIDAIRAALGHEGFIAYCRGQVIRYLWRLGKKDDALVEIGKAQVYAQWIKDTLDGKALTKGAK